MLSALVLGFRGAWLSSRSFKSPTLLLNLTAWCSGLIELLSVSWSADLRTWPLSDLDLKRQNINSNETGTTGAPVDSGLFQTGHLDGALQAAPEVKNRISPVVQDREVLHVGGEGAVFVQARYDFPLTLCKATDGQANRGKERKEVGGSPMPYA
jgi:hypothetical protein